MSFEFAKAAAAAERAAAAGTLQEEMAAVYDVLKYREEIQLALLNQDLLARCNGPVRGTDRLPIRDESGDDVGEVLFRVPRDLYFALRNQKNFGEDGFTTDDGLKDFGKAFPQFKARTVSGKVTSGYGGKGIPRRVRFGRGTMTFAT